MNRFIRRASRGPDSDGPAPDARLRLARRLKWGRGPSPSIRLGSGRWRAGVLFSAVAGVIAMLAVPAAPPGSAQSTRVVTIDDCIASVPERGESTPVEICFSVFKPPTASAADPVPLVLHSHGWGGTRTTVPSEFSDYLDAGIAVLSIDQRGHGQSTGYAHLQHPAFEGVDLRRVVRYVARLDWVLQDGRGDPRIGAIGGSYGGAYQYLAVLEHQRKAGRPVLDAIAPMSTWWSLPDSLGPAGLARTAWLRVLTATGGINLEPPVLAAAVEAGLTGIFRRKSTAGGVDLSRYLRRSGGAWHADRGLRIDVPTLIGSGTTDNLFPLEQGLRAWRQGLTRSARARSLVVAYNGGHNLPQLYPYGSSSGADPCSVKLGSPDFESLAFRFMRDRLLHVGGLRGLGRVHIATFDGECTTVRTVAPTTPVRIDAPVTTSLGSGAVYVPLAEGPLRVAGRTILHARVSTAGDGARAFYALAVGTSPATAAVVQNNMIPIHEPTAVASARRVVELPSVAVDLQEGQTLYLAASPAHDMFAGTSSLQPGTVRLERAEVRLPVLEGRGHRRDGRTRRW